MLGLGEGEVVKSSQVYGLCWFHEVVQGSCPVCIFVLFLRTDIERVVCAGKHDEVSWSEAVFCCESFDG